MLTRSFRTFGVLALVGLVVVAGAGPALASGGVNCLPGDDTCYVQVGHPGSPGGPSAPGSGGSTGTASPCHWPTGQPVPCFDSTFGWWSNSDACYYTLSVPQPAKTDPLWAGHTTGAIYASMCPGSGGTGGGWLWLPNPPAGFGGGPSPATLAVQAVSRMLLRGPNIGMAPGAGETGLVGLPVWMWTTVTPQTWGPISATAAVPGLSVTATARVVAMVWDMGDGSSVTCTGPGTPYVQSMGDIDSPDCGYRYTRSSAGQPGNAYPVTATTTWAIRWAGGGQTGTLTQTRTTATTVRIGELQVLVS